MRPFGEFSNPAGAQNPHELRALRVFAIPGNLAFLRLLGHVPGTGEHSRRRSGVRVVGVGQEGHTGAKGALGRPPGPACWPHAGPFCMGQKNKKARLMAIMGNMY